MAGRDGAPARCVLFFDRGDAARIRYFIDQVTDDTERGRLRAALNEMVLYAGGSSVCRRRRILAYFGEDFTARSCGACDVCAGGGERVDATREAQMVLSAVARTGERFGARHVIAVLRGGRARDILKFGHDRLPTYGVGRSLDRKRWRVIVEGLVADGLLEATGARYASLRLGRDAPAVLQGRQQWWMVKRGAVPAPVSQPRQSAPSADLFERLRALRYRLATQRHVPAYVVFADRTLRDMATRLPRTMREMLEVHGVGDAKLAAYGEAFLREIAEYHAETGITQALPQPQATATAPAQACANDTVLTTWDFLQHGLDIPSVADARELSEETVTEHVARLVLDGRVTDIRPYVPDIARAEIERVLTGMHNEFLRPVVQACAVPVTYDQVRLVRAWVMRRRRGAGRAEDSMCSESG